MRIEESALLIDPCEFISAKHLIFNSDGKVAPRNNSEIGKSTIKVLDLNRNTLVEGRKRAFEKAYENLLNRNWRYFKAIPTGYDLHRQSSKVLTRLEKQETHVFDYAIAFPGATTKALLEVYYHLEGFEGDLSELLEHKLKGEKTSPSDQMVAPIIESPKSIIINQDFISLRHSKSFRRQVKKIEIKNFKALKDITIELPNSVSDHVSSAIILGENSTGKSSILEAIGLALIGQSNIKKLKARLPKGVISPHEFVHRSIISDRSTASEEPLVVSIDFGDNLTADLRGYANDLNFESDAIQSKIILGYSSHRYFLKKKRRYRSPEYRLVSLFDPKVMIPDPSEWLNTKAAQKIYPAIMRALKPILMLGDDEVVFQDGKILIEIQGVPTSFDKLSMGYKSVITMAIDIIRELVEHFDNFEDASAVVLIDEVENHLHPRWKIQILSGLKQAFPKVQFIVTTHDALCLRGMKNGEIFVLKRSYREDLESYSGPPDIFKLDIKPGMDADDVLTSAGFGLSTTFIDENMEPKISEYARLLLEKDRKRLEEEEFTSVEQKRISEMRVELSTAVTGLLIGESDEDLILSAIRNEGLEEESIPSNFEAALKKALSAEE